MALRPTPARSLDPTAASMPISWPALYERVGELFEQSRLYYFPGSEARLKFTAELVLVITSIREYAISNEDDVLVIWDAIRGLGQMTVDLLMQLTTDIVLEMGGVSAYKPYLPLMAEAIHVIVPRATISGKDPEMLGVTDDPFMDSLGDAESLTARMQENPWLFTLLLLRRSGRMTLVRHSTTPGSPQPPDEE